MEPIVQHDTQRWETPDLHLAHHQIAYASRSWMHSHSGDTAVRLHFGLKGGYRMKLQQLGLDETLSGQHNNLLYTNGLDLSVENQADFLETFGVRMSPAFFLSIAAHEPSPSLQRFVEKVMRQEACLLSPNWFINPVKIQQIFVEIFDCKLHGGLRDLFLLSKSLELLVLVAAQRESPPSPVFVKSRQDRDKLVAAQALLAKQLETPPTIPVLAREVGLNEYKLKRGFRELFGTTIFGFVHKKRMDLARKLLLDTDLSAKEIAYEAGYSSPQHFSRAFKAEFGLSPDRMRKAPDGAIDLRN